MSKYDDLIASQHADKPKFVAVIDASVKPSIDQQAEVSALPADFDIDTAVGAQLDVVGEWVGIGRKIKTALTGVYFSFDIVGVGFDQGVWLGPFDPTTGLTTLADPAYRVLLKAEIALNYWDGTTPVAAAALIPLFPLNHIYLRDNQNMTMTVSVAGPPVDPVAAALLTGGYLALRAATVRFDYYFASASDGPVFGFDADTAYIGGFDEGSWGISAPFTG
jgi:hypothetical protein